MTNAMAKPAIPLDVKAIRRDFPVLSREFYGKPLVYLDNGATTQKPRQVIDRISKFYSEEYGTVRRGVYALCEGSTNAYNDVREKTARFLNAGSSSEIVFVRGTTEAVNLVAHGYGQVFIQEGDEVVISAMEHHANIVPWQQVCEAKGAKLRVAPINDNGELLLEDFENLLTERTKMVAIAHVSNSLGTINPIRRIVELAHAKDIPVFVDGAQGAPHMKVDVQALDCDFYAFSGHKIYGPTGVGVLYGKEKYLTAMAPYQTGGDMIETVTFEETTFAEPPYKFEAGTPPIAQVIGLGAALDYVETVGLDAIAQYEHHLLDYATKKLREVPGLTIIGNARMKASLISFTMEAAHPLDIGTLVDLEGIAIRTGHHCAQPVMRRFNVPATARASFAFYNTEEEIDKLVAALYKVIEMCGPQTCQRP